MNQMRSAERLNVSITPTPTIRANNTRKWLEEMKSAGAASEMGEIFDEPAILELPAEALSGVIRSPKSIGPAV